MVAHEHMAPGMLWGVLRRDHARGEFYCGGCGGDFGMRESALGTRHFFHVARSEQDCGWAPESSAHLTLKAYVYSLAIAAGWDAALEVPGGVKNREWRADVMLRRVSRRVVVEVQVSELESALAIERTTKHLRAGHELLWLCLDRDQQWRLDVPGLLVADAGSGGYEVHDGPVRLDRSRILQRVPPVSRARRPAAGLVPRCFDLRALGRHHGWREPMRDLGFEPWHLAAHDGAPAELSWVFPERASIRIKPERMTLDVFMGAFLGGDAVAVFKPPTAHWLAPSDLGIRDGRAWPHIVFMPWSEYPGYLIATAAVLGWTLTRDLGGQCRRCGRPAMRLDPPAHLLGRRRPRPEATTSACARCDQEILGVLLNMRVLQAAPGSS